MHTKKAAAIHSRRRELEQKRLDRIRGRIAAGELVSMASDSKWVKILDELAACCDRQANVLVKTVDGAEPIECRGLLSSYFDDGGIEFQEGFLFYWEIEWIRVPFAGEPAFSFSVDYGIQEGAITVQGYRRT